MSEDIKNRIQALSFALQTIGPPGLNGKDHKEVVKIANSYYQFIIGYEDVDKSKRPLHKP